MRTIVYDAREGRIIGACGIPPSLLRFVLVELVLDGIDQSEPAGFDDVFADADGAPGVVVVRRLDEYADAGGGAGFAVDDADFVVDQPHLTKAGKIAVHGLTHGGVEGVDGAVALGHFHSLLAFDADFDRRFRYGRAIA